MPEGEPRDRDYKEKLLSMYRHDRENFNNQAKGRILGLGGYASVIIEKIITVDKEGWTLEKTPKPYKKFIKFHDDLFTSATRPVRRITVPRGRLEAVSYADSMVSDVAGAARQEAAGQKATAVEAAAAAELMEVAKVARVEAAREKAETKQQAKLAKQEAARTLKAAQKEARRTAEYHRIHGEFNYGNDPSGVHQRNHKRLAAAAADERELQRLTTEKAAKDADEERVETARTFKGQKAQKKAEKRARMDVEDEARHIAYCELERRGKTDDRADTEYVKFRRERSERMHDERAKRDRKDGRRSVFNPQGLRDVKRGQQHADSYVQLSTKRIDGRNRFASYDAGTVDHMVEEADSDGSGQDDHDDDAGQAYEGYNEAEDVDYDQGDDLRAEIAGLRSSEAGLVEEVQHLRGLLQASRRSTTKTLQREPRTWHLDMRSNSRVTTTTTASGADRLWQNLLDGAASTPDVPRFDPRGMSHERSSIVRVQARELRAMDILVAINGEDGDWVTFQRSRNIQSPDMTVHQKFMYGAAFYRVTDVRRTPEGATRVTAVMFTESPRSKGGPAALTANQAFPEHVTFSVEPDDGSSVLIANRTTVFGNDLEETYQQEAAERRSDTVSARQSSSSSSFSAATSSSSSSGRSDRGRGDGHNEHNDDDHHPTMGLSMGFRPAGNSSSSSSSSGIWSDGRSSWNGHTSPHAGPSAGSGYSRKRAAGDGEIDYDVDDDDVPSDDDEWERAPHTGAKMMGDSREPKLLKDNAKRHTDPINNSELIVYFSGESVTSEALDNSRPFRRIGDKTLGTVAFPNSSMLNVDCPSMYKALIAGMKKLGSESQFPEHFQVASPQSQFVLRGCKSLLRFSGLPAMSTTAGLTLVLQGQGRLKHFMPEGLKLPPIDSLAKSHVADALVAASAILSVVMAKEFRHVFDPLIDNVTEGPLSHDALSGPFVAGVVDDIIFENFFGAMRNGRSTIESPLHNQKFAFDLLRAMCRDEFVVQKYCSYAAQRAFDNAQGTQAKVALKDGPTTAAAVATAAVPKKVSIADPPVEAARSSSSSSGAPPKAVKVAPELKRLLGSKTLVCGVDFRSRLGVSKEICRGCRETHVDVSTLTRPVLREIVEIHCGPEAWRPWGSADTAALKAAISRGPKRA